MARRLAMTASPGIEISVVSELDDLESLRNEWEALEWSLPHVDPNANLDHFRLVVQALDGAIRPYVVKLTRDGVPVAMLVARIDRERLQFKVGYKTLFQPMVDNLRVVYGGVLSGDASPWAAFLIGELVASLREGEADLLTLPPQAEDAPLLRAAMEVPHLTRDHFPRSQLHWRVRLPQRFEDYVSALSKESRKKLRKRHNRLVKTFGDTIEYCSYREPDEVDDLMRAAEMIATQTYQRGLGVGFRDNLLTRQRLTLAAEKGWLRSFILRLDGRPAAYQLGFAYGDSYYAMGRGFDSEFRDYDVGTTLFEHALKEAIESEGIEYWDFGIGDAAHKRRFGNESWEEVGIRVFAPTLRGVLLNLAWSITRGVDRLARRLLASRSDDIKRIWRRALRRKAGDAAR